MSDARAIVRSRRGLLAGWPPVEDRTAEGGCGVIGVIGTAPLRGRYIIRSCEQMQNRGNGKGGGVAAVGLFDAWRRHYALHVAYLEPAVRAEVERAFVEPVFSVAHAERQPSLDDHRAVGLEVRPPEVWRYFVRAKPDVLQRFAAAHGIAEPDAAEDELVFQNSFRLNRTWYAATGRPPQAFVLSHGRDLMILKAVGYAEQVARYYRLEEQRAHVWIGHQRYPTRGRVWHPGGAHPFVGVHEALVHNGDFANYHAVSEYLRQHGLVPLFVTDTEVSVLLFDLYARVLRYPLEYVIEALAPTPEGDFERLPKRRQRIYRALQTAHLHGSPDGPWFFIVARTAPATGAPELLGITDVSMLRPQVFAVQQGRIGLGAIASEKQAIDAFFEEVHADLPEVPCVADRYWNARGGSCTDGGAFAFTLVREGTDVRLDVRDKFGAAVGVAPRTGERRGAPAELRRAFAVGPQRAADNADLPGPERGPRSTGAVPSPAPREPRASASGHPNRGLQPAALPGTASGPRVPQAEACGSEGGGTAMADLPQALCAGDDSFVRRVERLAESDWRGALAALTWLRDRRWDPRGRRRAELLARLDDAVQRLLDGLPAWRGPAGHGARRVERATAWDGAVPAPAAADELLAIDARGFPPEGPACVARLIVAAHAAGWRRFAAYRLRGDRFLGCGLGPATADVRIDAYGSSGDYLGSGLDGAEIAVHGNAQDQVGQILKSGRLVIYGDVGQTFLYGAKGGEAFVMGSAAGRPLINAVGRIRAVINGTCLDYCAESFMAGDELGGGFVIINGLAFDDRGDVIGLETKYPGNNLFSLASGGACYLNDPYRTVGESQLNGSSFVPFQSQDWGVILPSLQRNEELFGIAVRRDLLVVDGVLKWPKEVFRKVVASHETHKLDWSSLPG